MSFVKNILRKSSLGYVRNVNITNSPRNIFVKLIKKLFASVLYVFTRTVFFLNSIVWMPWMLKIL